MCCAASPQGGATFLWARRRCPARFARIFWDALRRSAYGAGRSIPLYFSIAAPKGLAPEGPASRPRNAFAAMSVEESRTLAICEP